MLRSTVEAQRPHVLIVEEDPDSREELLHQLVGQGHALELADSLEAALPLMQRLRPQVVVVGLGHGKPQALRFLEDARRASSGPISQSCPWLRRRVSSR